MFVSQGAFAWSQSNSIVVISTFASGRTFASSPSTEGATIDSLGVSAFLKEEGIQVDNQSNICDRTPGQFVTCSVEAIDTTVTNTCKYCTWGEAIAWNSSNIYESVLLPMKCKVYLAGGNW